MKLDTPLDIKGPYNVRGTVDIYFSNGQWIARSWPKRPKQPNSPSQLNARLIFRKMLDSRKLLSEEEYKVWSKMILPPDKTWDDIWRSSALKTLHTGAAIYPQFGHQQSKIVYVRLDNTNPPPAWQHAHLAGTWWPGDLPMIFSLDHAWIWNDSSDNAKWIVNGLLCYAGKKEIPHYFLSLPDTSKFPFLFWGGALNGDFFNGKGCYSNSIGKLAVIGYKNYRLPSYDLDSYRLNAPLLLFNSPDFVFDYAW